MTQRPLARATDGSTRMVGASVTKGGRATIARFAALDLGAMPVRRSVMQKTLARATDSATIMVGAHATKGGRAAIVRIARSDLWEIFVRRSVMQRPLERAKDGATRMGGANVAIRSWWSRSWMHVPSPPRRRGAACVFKNKNNSSNISCFSVAEHAMALLFPHAHNGRAAPARALASVGPCGSPCNSGSQYLVTWMALLPSHCDYWL